MISCNKMTASPCSISCPISVGRIIGRPELIIVLGHETFRWLWVMTQSRFKGRYTVSILNLCVLSKVEVLYIGTCIWQLHVVLFPVGARSAVYILYVYKAHFDGRHLASTVITVFDQTHCTQMMLPRTTVSCWYVDFRCKVSLLSTDVLGHSQNCNFTSFTVHLLLLFVCNQQVVCYIVLFSSFFFEGGGCFLFAPVLFCQ